MIHQLPIGPLESNTYIVENGTDAVIFDPSDYLEPILELIAEKHLKVHAIICTHLHFDHVSGVAAISKHFNVPVYAGQGDIDYKDTFFSRTAMYGVEPTVPFEPQAIESATVHFGSLECTNIHTPGHSPGGYCFYFPADKSVITGDTLFYRSIGRSDFPGGNLETLLSSVREKLFVLPEDTQVYPGHGPASRIGDEIKSNPFLA